LALPSERRGGRRQRAGIAGRFVAAGGEAKSLPHETLSNALRTGELFAQLDWSIEGPIFGPTAKKDTGRVNGSALFCVSPKTDAVESLETKADAVEHLVALYARCL
jgi:hypothetical protein